MSIRGARQLTVRELIAALQALPPEALDALVEVEGCDCMGDCGGVDYSPPADEGRPGYVSIERIS